MAGLPWEINDATRSQTSRVRVVKVDDKKSQQRVDLKGRKNEEPGEILNVQPHGFASNPPKDTEGVTLQMGGRGDRSLLLLGSHEKFRPKETPEGGSVLYNHTGDIIRVFKENLDVVHSKKINIKVGKGNDVGQGGGESETNISIVATGSSIVVTFDDASVTWAPGQLTLKSPKVVIDSADINLGGEGGEPVGLCGGGCATKVRAI